MDPLFATHFLSAEGKEKAKKLTEAFSSLMQAVIDICGPSGREVAIVKTKLEEASFFAKKAMSSRTENQEPP